MSLNFNVDPYYDDFDPSKNYYRILFKPGYAVQARELTQSQSILQDQVHKFADNIFKQNSPVTGGQVTTDLNCYYIKLQTTYAGVVTDVTQFLNKNISDETGTILAKVVAVATPTGTGGAGDPPTLIVVYKSGNQFADNAVVYDTESNLAAQAITNGSTGPSAVVSIAQGVFYISGSYKNSNGSEITTGTFVQVNPQTVIVGKYSNQPSVRVGLNITESKQSFAGDATLLDPAVGASNYQAPGADRYKITLTLETRPVSLGDDDTFIELLRIENGQIQKLVNGSVYNVIDDYFAKRDYETNGDYVVSDFKLTPKTTVDSNTYNMSIGKGVAYVHGYRVESQSTTDIISNRARTTASQTNNPIFMDYGSYLIVNSVRGANGSFFDTSTYQPVDFHTITSANTLNANTYGSTLVATGYIRGLVFDHATSDTNANTYVYRAYVSDLQNQVFTANVVSATTNTVTLPTWFSTSNSAYTGVNVSITKGTDAGDFRTITSYNGVTKVATINQNWTVTPDTTSIIALNFDVKDIEAMANTSVKSSYPLTVYATAAIDPSSKVNGVSTGNTLLENPVTPELVFPIGNPYVASLANTSFTTQQVFRNVQFSSDGAGFSYTVDFSGTNGAIRHIPGVGVITNPSVKEQNYTIIVDTVGVGCTLNVGDNVPWTTAGRSITILDGSSTAAKLYASDIGTNGFTATVIVKAQVQNGNDAARILKTKTLITANQSVINSANSAINANIFVDDTPNSSTGQILIKKPALVAPGQKQSLYLSDVKNIVKIIDTRVANTNPTVAMLSDPAHDVTKDYIFDNGQRDNFYDHASITLSPGASQPLGDILVLVNYYQHSGGDGYFSINSYRNESYTSIPNYTSKHGVTYSLRDCVDFRPARKNAQTQFLFRYTNTSPTSYGVYLPLDLSTFQGNYAYYLGRKDKLILTKDKSFQMIEGTPSINPIFPSESDGSLVIAEITHNPYTGYIPGEAPNGVVADMSVAKVKHKRYTMQDIAGLENRINNVEYYTSLSQLEQSATSLQISDAYGLNRFKNGIMVDDFSSYATADTLSNDYSATINKRTRQMTATQNVKNFPLKSLALAYNQGLPSSETSTTLGYAVNTDGYINYFSLPYTTSNVASQKFASRTVNVNPFSTSVREGVVSLSPNVDNWVDTDYSPALLITDPNMQVFQSSTKINVLTAGDWQTISGTSSATTDYTIGHNINPSPYGFVGYATTTTATTTTQASSSILGPYNNIGSTYSLNNGYITDISVLPYIRPQETTVSVTGLLFNTTLNAYFDNSLVNNYIHKTNVIELTGVTGTFNVGDVVGYFNSPTFVPTATILGIHYYADKSRVRLYVGADAFSTTYQASGTFQNGFFNSSGAYAGTTAHATIASTTHWASRIVASTGSPVGPVWSNTITLSPLAANTDIYTGKTFYINAGAGVGVSSQLFATITAYNPSTKVVTLSAPIAAYAGDVYSIGPLVSDESGAFYGIFNIPGNQFHTGQRVLRVDNSTAGNPSSATTYAEGTYYAEGLHTQSQQVDFGASPSGAKGTFNSVVTQTTSQVVTSLSPWDPVAQTFIIDGNNYPNGVFLNSVKLFFRTKANDNSPITLSIVGTLNGYPNGITLDHSIITKSSNQIKISENPQYLDSAAYTEFKFGAPVYIQPNTLYSFIVKTSSSEYTLWTASNGDAAVASSVSNIPPSDTANYEQPSTVTKIGSAPYVGALFISQNAQTWTADQNQSLMFVLDRCVFNTTATPTIPFVVPKKLPQRTIIDQSINYFLNANNILSNTNVVSNNAILVDAFNITTTDFVPTTTNLNYNYNATLVGGASAGQKTITPGKYGTSASENIYLNDGLGERILDANVMDSLVVYSQMSTMDDAVSPIISDAGLTTYAITWNINNCSLSNNLITLVSGGSGYGNSNTVITISSPTGKDGLTATLAANVVDGVIQSIYVPSTFGAGGSGYITTPTITITGSGTGASAIVTGETSAAGGPALSKYVTKKVVLDAGNDSGDLSVYVTAYRPVGTDINVYYKILNRTDTQAFESGAWQLMTKTNSSDTLYSTTRTDTHEYSFAPGSNGFDQGFVTYTSTNGQTYTTFSQFAIKVVLTTTDNTAVPYLSDLRAIALPANVNTSV